MLYSDDILVRIQNNLGFSLHLTDSLRSEVVKQHDAHLRRTRVSDQKANVLSVLALVVPVCKHGQQL